MKILKFSFYVILAITILFFIVGLFLPEKYEVKRSIEINASDTVIYNYVADFRNFYDWNPWTSYEPGHKFEVSGDSASIGQKYYWEGEKVGSGQMVFTKLEPYYLIVSDIEFFNPNRIGAVEWQIDRINENSTNVTWSINGEAEYPVGRYFALFMDNLIGKDFENGIKNLKEKVE